MPVSGAMVPTQVEARLRLYTSLFGVVVDVFDCRSLPTKKGLV